MASSAKSTLQVHPLHDGKRDPYVDLLMNGPRMGSSARARHLHKELTLCFGVRTPVVVRCLRQKFQIFPGAEPSDAQLDAIEDTLTQAFARSGGWWTSEEPRWIASSGWRPRGDLLIWLQHLRRDVGEEMEVFAPTKGHEGDPLWLRVSRWFGAQLGELLTEAGIPRECHQLLKAQARRNICNTYDVLSTRHLPASICQREVVHFLLRCQLRGVRNVLDLSFVEEMLRTRRAHEQGVDQDA